MAAESEALRERIRKAIASQTQSNVNVLSSLHAVLDELGYVPDEAIEEVAESAGTTINTVWGVASFYTNFRFTPPGDHIVEICWGPTCHLLGATVILQGVLDDLGMSDEGETADPVIAAVEKAVRACAKKAIGDDDAVAEEVRIAARRAFRQISGKKPITSVHLVRI